MSTNKKAGEKRDDIPDTSASSATKPKLVKINVVSKNSKTGKKTFKCVICSSTFDSQKDLLVHFREHGQIKPRVFEENSKNNHDSLSLIECEWCPETFVNLSRAIEHKFRKHKYESTNYFCEICGKLFPLKVALEQHFRIEHKEQKATIKTSRLNFICQFCKQKFMAKEALDLHMNTAHQLQKRMMMRTFLPDPSKKVKLNQAGEAISVYYCHLCGAEYMVKYNLMKHIEVHHPFEERCRLPETGLIRCTTCESVFYSQKAFSTHNMYHKEDDLYVTSEEHRRSIVARVDQDFDYRRVPTTMDKLLLPIKAEKSAAALSKKHSKKSATTISAVSTLKLGPIVSDPLSLE